MRSILVALIAWLAPATAIAAEKDAADAHAFDQKPGSIGFVASAALGDGLRFDNPYRLSTVLGSDAQSLSRSAAYVDLGATALFGAPYGIRHGIALRWSIAVEGIAQSALAPTYVAWKRWRAFAGYGRLGPSIVLAPNGTWGAEAALGAIWFARAGIGVSAELLGDVFYGAGTREVATPAYPILSGEIGIVVDYEVLP